MLQDYIQPVEKIYYTLPIPKDHPFIEVARNFSEFTDISKKYTVDFQNATLNIYKGLTGSALTIPIQEDKANEGKAVVVYFTETNEVNSIQIITLQTTTDGFNLTFSSADESLEITGIFENDEYIETVVNDKSEIHSSQTRTQCIDAAFKRLPYALQAVCFAACAAILTAPGLAACAGCLVGLGIHC
ncbi:hypothetical protein [Priestia megaterium]|uniref:hypothetical protein n=1 Tax=Priestia megaterium TaxID=1404 RepID=UPI003D2695C7